MYRFILYITLVFLSVNNAFSSVYKEYPSFAHIVQDLTPTVVNISTTQTIKNNNTNLDEILPQLPPDSPFRFFFKEFLEKNIPNQGQARKNVSSLGSGFIISEDGYIITNSHVVDKADIIDVKFNDGRVVRAKIIGIDKKSDIALLKVDIKHKLAHVQFGDSDLLAVGDWVIAIGNPFGLGGTVTAGIVSARGRNISDGSNTDFIQTDAAINRGNSGGPMFNTKGELVGISTAIFSNSGGNIGIGFAIPTQTALPVIKQLKEKGHVVRGWLGVNIQYVTPALAEALGLEQAKGAYVVGVADSSPAQRGGIKIDDLIIKFDGKEVTKMNLLPNIVANTRIGKKVKVVVFRNIENKLVKRTLNIRIAKLDDLETTKNIETKNDEISNKYKEYLGFKLAPLNNQIRQKYNIVKDVSGVLVVGFSDNDHRFLSGIQVGDVINKVNQITINSVSEFIKVAKKSKLQNKQHILLSVKRGDISAAITLNIQSLANQEK